MNNRKLEFYALSIVLIAFCGCTAGLVVALFKHIAIDTAVPLVDGTLGTLAMAMWKDFSHSNQEDNSNNAVVAVKETKTLNVPTEEVKS